MLLSGVVVVIILFLFSLISILKRNTKKEINYLAFHDQLTGSFNYTKFKREFEKKKDVFSSRYALALFDIYNFRAVNAIFGYEAGDRVLRSIYGLIKSRVTPNELYCRFAEDKFLLLLECPERGYMLNRLETFFRIAENTIFSSDTMDYRITCRCGLYELKPDDEHKSFQTLSDCAFEARENIINISHSTASFFDEKLQQRLDRKNKITRYMHSSLEKEEFLIYLQPKYAILDEQPILSGAEALVRWKLNGTEFIYPDSFIPAFEENGFITQLDMYMLDHVCGLIKAWISEGHPGIPVSVNQSRLHIYNPNYVHDIQLIVDKHGIPYNLIEFEITESAIVEDSQQVRNQFRQLRKLGFKTSMDDFGSGLSTLNMLQGSEADIIKIDKGFFDSSLDTENGQIIVASIITMLRNLDFEIVAEGIETGEQVAFLKKCGCTYVQGYYFGKPEPYADFEHNHLYKKSVPTDA